jgi:hypothetical protein
VDLFLYGLNEKQAIEKIKEIETCIRGNVLADTTTIRTKNTITICSQFPVMSSDWDQMIRCLFGDYAY